MISSEELENNYAKYTDSEIINLAKNSKGLRPEAVFLLTKEIKKRNLKIEVNDPKIFNTFIEAEINSYVLEKYPTAKKTYPHKPGYIQNVSYFSIGFGIIIYYLFRPRFDFINILSFSIFNFLFLIIPLFLIFLGVKILNRKDKMVQLILFEKHILFKQQRNFGKYRIEDFYHKFISDKYVGIYFDQIEDIIIPTNFLRVGALYFLTYTGDKVYVLINCDKIDLPIIVDDLKKRIGLIN